MDGKWDGLERRRLGLEALEARVRELEADRDAILRARRRRLRFDMVLSAAMGAVGAAAAMAIHLLRGW